MCFQTDLTSRRAFVLGLVASEVLGRTVSVAGVVAISYTGFKLFSAIARVAPMVVRGLAFMGAGGSIYMAYRALNRHYEGGTPEQQALALEIIENTRNQPSALIASVKALLNEEIDELENDLAENEMSMEIEERRDLLYRIMRLNRALDSIVESSSQS